MEYGYKGKDNLFHLMTNSEGRSLYATLTGANENERIELPKLLDKIRVVGLSIVEADKGYDSKAVRLKILKRRILSPYSLSRREERC